MFETAVISFSLISLIGVVCGAQTEGMGEMANHSISCSPKHTAGHHQHVEHKCATPEAAKCQTFSVHF